MAKVIEMSSPKNGKASAADICERLDAGKRAESELVEQRDQAALDEMDGVAGATAKVAALNARIEVVRSERQTLEGVYRLAVERERLADVASRTKIRGSQLAAFQSHGRERLDAAQEFFGAVATMAAAMQRYGAAPRKMVGVVPIGTHLPVLMLGPDGVFGTALGNMEHLVASGLFCSVPNADGVCFLPPFAKPNDAQQRRPQQDACRL